MSLPPEHISVKRRRQEEPVDLLCEQSAYAYGGPLADEILQILKMSVTKPNADSQITAFSESKQTPMHLRPRGCHRETAPVRITGQ